MRISRQSLIDKSFAKETKEAKNVKSIEKEVPSMWKEQLLSFAEQFEHSSWGVAHCARVYETALALAEAQAVAVDKDALLAAAYLHDMGAFEPYKKEDVEHSERSTQVVSNVLITMGFPTEKIALVKDIIRGHMFYSTPAKQAEAIIFRDADILDFLGAIGVARILSLIKKDNWAPDLPSAINLIKRFNQELPHRLSTLKAQQIAKERHAETDMFLSALSKSTTNLQVL